MVTIYGEVRPGVASDLRVQEVLLKVECQEIVGIYAGPGRSWLTQRARHCVRLFGRAQTLVRPAERAVSSHRLNYF